MMDGEPHPGRVEFGAEGLQRRRLRPQLVVRLRAAEDIFQNVALEAMTRGATFESAAALLLWAFITARHEGIGWFRRQFRETVGIEAEVRELLERECEADAAVPAGAC
ncbi:MAG: hypothetical protein ACKVYV_16145 [Limisphaerales bacterium]